MDDATRERFEEFYRVTYRSLVAELYPLTGDLASAQDLAQDAYARAWLRWERLSAYDDPLAWVRLVGRRLAVSRWRRATSAVRTLARHGVAAPLPGPGPESVALVAALKRLPAAQRRALVLHHMGGHSVADIASAEGVAEGTIKARLSRGRAAMAVLLAEPPATTTITTRRTEALHG